MAATSRWRWDRRAGASGAIQFHGVITGEDGRPVPDALIETWLSAGDDNNAVEKTGLLRSDGWINARPTCVITDQQGRYSVKMVPPQAPEHGSAPFIAVSVEARGSRSADHPRLPSGVPSRQRLPAAPLARRAAASPYHDPRRHRTSFRHHTAASNLRDG